MYEKMNILAITSVEDVEKLDEEELIEFLREEKNLHLDKNDITIFRNKRIFGYAFFGLIEENLRSYGMVERPLISLIRFAKKIKLGK